MREWFLGIIFVAAAGCGGESEGARATPSSRDSAGIRIVESAAPGPHLARWVVPDSALVDIGGADEGPTSFTRIAGAFWDAAGRIVVADGGAGELRRFDSTGGFLDRFGRQGEGPGEFRMLGLAWANGDSTVAYDPILRRMTEFGPDGQLARTTSTASIPHPYSVLPLEGARLLLTFIQMDTSGATSGPMVRLPMFAAVTARDTIRLDTVLTVPGMESYPVLSQEGEASFPAQAFPMFGRWSIVTAAGDRILAATNDAFEIAEYSADGTLQRLLRVALPPEAPTEAHHREYLDQELRRLEEFNAAAPEALRAQWRNQLRERRVSEQFPFVDNVIPADDAHLWAEVYRWRADEPERYLIFDPSGRLVAQAELPERVRLLAIREGLLLGRWRDADDVQHVRVYPVRRPDHSHREDDES